jgi:hypothetical protein
VHRRHRTGSMLREEEPRWRGQLDGHGPGHSRVALGRADPPISAAPTDRRLAHGGVSLASPFAPAPCCHELGSTIDSHVPQNRTKTMLSRPQKRTKRMPSRAKARAALPIWARPSVRDGGAGRRGTGRPVVQWSCDAFRNMYENLRPAAFVGGWDHRASQRCPRTTWASAGARRAGSAAACRWTTADSLGPHITPASEQVIRLRIQGAPQVGIAGASHKVVVGVWVLKHVPDA